MSGTDISLISGLFVNHVVNPIPSTIPNSPEMSRIPGNSNKKKHVSCCGWVHISQWKTGKNLPIIFSLQQSKFGIQTRLNQKSAPRSRCDHHIWRRVPLEMSRPQFSGYPLVNIQKAIKNGPVEIVDFPNKNGGSFHSKMLVHQRVSPLNPIKSHENPLNHHFPMVFLWFSYGFPMVFLWFSYGFPMFTMSCSMFFLSNLAATWSWNWRVAHVRMECRTKTSQISVSKIRSHQPKWASLATKNNYSSAGTCISIKNGNTYQMNVHNKVYPNLCLTLSWHVHDILLLAVYRVWICINHYVYIYILTIIIHVGIGLPMCCSKPAIYHYIIKYLQLFIICLTIIYQDRLSWYLRLSIFTFWD